MLASASIPVVLDDRASLHGTIVTSRPPTRCSDTRLRALVERQSWSAHTRRVVVPRVLPCVTLPGGRAVQAALVEWRPTWRRHDDVMIWNFMWVLDAPVTVQSIKEALTRGVLEDWGPLVIRDVRFGELEQYATLLTLRESRINLQRRDHDY